MNKMYTACISGKSAIPYEVRPIRSIGFDGCYEASRGGEDVIQGEDVSDTKKGALELLVTKWHDEMVEHFQTLCSIIEINGSNYAPITEETIKQLNGVVIEQCEHYYRMFEKTGDVDQWERSEGIGVSYDYFYVLWCNYCYALDGLNKFLEHERSMDRYVYNDIC